MLQCRQPDFSKVPRITDEVCNLVVVITLYQHTRNCNSLVYISEQSDQLPSTTLVPYHKPCQHLLGDNIMCHPTLQASESSSLKSIKK